MLPTSLNIVQFDLSRAYLVSEQALRSMQLSPRYIAVFLTSQTSNHTCSVLITLLKFIKLSGIDRNRFVANSFLPGAVIFSERRFCWDS